MRYPQPSDPELMTAIRRYVSPGRRYLKLLHGNCLGLDTGERDRFAAELAADARTITDHELGVLLDSEWRARMTALGDGCADAPR
ncbi:DUF6000 family protein [Dactylosporangium sp. NPDC000521]|uniref:DUF6000 family protein n=1 Tax=Dactylosporangium sp. NPDC000521 TaxID=3363975 RepID=UPI0036CEFC66